MPAKPDSNIVESGYFHIFNQGILGSLIFKDNEDCNVFLEYLKEYLTPPKDPSTYKKDFTIDGKVYSGVPHRLKNYSKSISLISYKLEPDHFNLLIYRLDKQSMEKFMRSLLTRYSIFFNKKYERKGRLFNGPYQSAYIKDALSLILLTRYLHRNNSSIKNRKSNEYSSYKAYLGKNDDILVKPDVILSYFSDNGNTKTEKIASYKKFVENHQIKEKEKKLLERILFKNYSEPLEGIRASKIKETPYKKKAVNQKVKTTQEQKSNFVPPLVSTALFIVLFSIGFKNVQAQSVNSSTTIYNVSSNVLGKASNQLSDSSNKIYETLSTYIPVIKSKLAIFSTETISKDDKSTQSLSLDTPSPPSTNQSVAGIESYSDLIKLQIYIEDEEVESINIYKKPSLESEIIGKALDGTVFELISNSSNWYETKLHDQAIGYIESKYIKELK